MSNEVENTSKIIVPDSAVISQAPIVSAKKSWNFDRLMSFAALLISLATFVTFGYQNYLIQKQQYGSVLPYLRIENSYMYDSKGQPVIGLQLSNNGVGPAFIEQVNITYQGKRYSSISDFFIQGVYVKTPINTGRNDIYEGYVLPAGQFQLFLHSNDSTAARVLEKIFRANDLRIEITYSSLYKEKWRMYWDGRTRAKPIEIE